MRSKWRGFARCRISWGVKDCGVLDFPPVPRPIGSIMSGKPRILVIRGGALGDFLLTLPALRLIRESFGHCHLEIVGYRHIAELAVYGGPAEGQTYADAVRHIEAAPLAGFFARAGNLDPAWCEYVAGLQQIIR